MAQHIGVRNEKWPLKKLKSSSDIIAEANRPKVPKPMTAFDKGLARIQRHIDKSFD